MTQHHVSKVKHLLDLQNAIWTPAHIIPCEDHKMEHIPRLQTQTALHGRMDTITWEWNKRNALQYLKSHTKNQYPNLTWLYWIFYAEHGWPVSTPHGLEHFLLGQVRPSVLHPDAGLHVVEITAIQLKELDQQEAQVDVGTPRVDPRV